jgi:protein-disulfide isomerase
VCKAIEPKLDALLKTDKNVKLVIKEFPILTPQSLTATKVAFAADKQGKYGAFHQALMLYHGSLTDAYFGRAADILRQRANIKRQTIQHRRLQHRKIAA